MRKLLPILALLAWPLFSVQIVTAQGMDSIPDVNSLGGVEQMGETRSKDQRISEMEAENAALKRRLEALEARTTATAATVATATEVLP